MPKIDITEQEEATLTAFDITENVVLIPILYARNYDNDWVVKSEDDLKTKTYKSYKTFKNEFSASSGYPGGGKDSAGKRFIYVGESQAAQPDASYIMIYECLLHGLTVVVKPIAISDDMIKTHWDSANRRVVLTKSEYHEILEDAICNKNAFEEFKSRNIYNIKFITSGAYSNYGHCVYAPRRVVPDLNIQDPSVNSIYLNDALTIDPNATVGSKVVIQIESVSKTKTVVANYDTKSEVKLAEALIYDRNANIGDTVNVVALCSIADELVATAVSRGGDAIALCELKESFSDNKELLDELSGLTPDSNYKYSAMFYPWVNIRSGAVSSTIGEYKLPACFGYLMAYANSVQTNANWFAAAGVQRGYIPTLTSTTAEVSEALMHALQGDNASDVYAEYQLNVRVNPIMNTGNYGIRIWGNKTTYAGFSATGTKYTDFLNVRVLVCDIRKQLYHSSIKTTFEPNDDIVWLNFKTLTNTLLEKMKSGRGIQWYKWTKEKTSEKAVIKCNLEIKPIEAVESFDISITLTDEDLSAEESDQI